MWKMFLTRMKEPSTGAALAALVAIAAPQAAPLVGEAVTHSVALIGVAGGLWGVFKGEAG